MSRDFPDWIDVERAAQAERRFAGGARIEWMPRVVDLLDAPAPEDEIGFEISAALDQSSGAGDIVRLDIRVHGSVPMTCQRTLRRYWQPIDSHSSVAVVASEDQVSALPEDLEPKLVPEGRLKLVELVEDELLLALPLVPRDPDSAPVENAGDSFEPAESDDGGNKRDNPFAELARLRSKKD
ncbi:MAG TPA: YceD family protein [Wenzhouxiangellaceae bacterium]|nr:YceD family protein [Wenzhouxiangellaceae bacterium]